MTLHKIDRQEPLDKWSDDDLDRLLIFCLLDRATPYKKVCEAFDMLDISGFSTRKSLRDFLRAFGFNWLKNTIETQLTEIGYRFPKQGTDFILNFMINNIDLRKCSRVELIESVKGIGMKLASMFLRNTKGRKCAVIDTHLKKWLKKNGCPFTDYFRQEVWFLNYCKENNLDPYKFDMEIWNERRRK